MALPRLAGMFLAKSQPRIGANIMADNRQDALGLPLAKPLDEAAIREFSSNVRGELIRPEDDGYDDARSVFYRGIDRRPALIVRVANATDVSRVIGLAREIGSAS